MSSPSGRTFPLFEGLLTVRVNRSGNETTYEYTDADSAKTCRRQNLNPSSAASHPASCQGPPTA